MYFEYKSNKPSLLNKKNLYIFSENTLSLFSIKAIELALTIFLIPYLILKVGLVNYGHYAYAMALIYFFQNVLNYGFNLNTVREIAVARKSSKYLTRVFNEVLSVKLFLLFIILGLLGIMVLIIPDFNRHLNLYILATFVLIGDLFSLRWFYVGMEKMKFKAFINLIATLIYVLLVLIWVEKPEDYIWIPLAEGISLLLISVISFIWVIQKNRIKLKLLSFDEVRYYLKMNFNSFINLLIPSTFGVLAVFFVGVFGTTIQVSFMQIGVKVSNAFSTVITILTKVSFPMVNRIPRIMFTSRMVLLSVGLILSVVLFFFSSLVIPFWLKLTSENDLNQTIIVIKILSLTPFLMAVISAYGVNGLLIHNEDKLYRNITITAALVLLIAAVFFDSKNNYYGGALSLLVAKGIYAFMTYILFKIRIKKDAFANKI